MPHPINQPSQRNLNKTATRKTGAVHFPATLAGIAREQGCEAGAIEVWFADEARIGQKNGITRRWARRGSRPSAPRDQR